MVRHINRQTDGMIDGIRWLPTKPSQHTSLRDFVSGGGEGGVGRGKRKQRTGVLDGFLSYMDLTDI
jgi:hypothetical protein